MTRPVLWSRAALDELKGAVSHIAREILERRERLLRRSARLVRSSAFIAPAGKAEWTVHSRNPLQVCRTSSLTRLRRLPEASASSFSTSFTQRAIGLRDAGLNPKAVGCAGVDAAAGGAALTPAPAASAC